LLAVVGAIDGPNGGVSEGTYEAGDGGELEHARRARRRGGGRPRSVVCFGERVVGRHGEIVGAGYRRRHRQLVAMCVYAP
jgi:hypothetical protein